MRPLLAAAARGGRGRRAVRSLHGGGVVKNIRWWGPIVAAVVFVVDQVVKLIVTQGLGIRQLGDMMDVLPIFRLRFVPNVGVSLGLLPANSEAARWAPVVLTAGLAIGVAIWMLRASTRPHEDRRGGGKEGG